MKNYEYIQYFCENIKALRKICKLSKRKMSKKLGISRRWLSSLEKGKMPTELSVDVLISINRYFGVTPSKMFSPCCMD